MLTRFRYWSRWFKKQQERKRSGHMTDIPQLGPEVYIDDVDAERQKKQSSGAKLLSPLGLPTSSPFLAHGMDGARKHRSDSPGGGSPGTSPRLSPHRPTNSSSAFSFDGTELVEPPGSGNSSRRNSAVSSENVLDVLDIWGGESIRRSFTTTRPEKRGSS